MSRKTGTVEQALEDMRNGKIVLVIDDPDRENEGDMICAAEFATQENVNLMASEAKGADLHAYERGAVRPAGTGADGDQ